MSDKINANAPGYDAATPEYFYEQRIAELEKQLAERDEALARCVEASRNAMKFIRIYHWKDNAPGRGNWDLDAAGNAYEGLKSAAASIPKELEKQLALAKAEALEELQVTCSAFGIELPRIVDKAAAEYRAKATEAGRKE